MESDELISLEGSFDEDGGLKRDKFLEFNKQTDMIDPQFRVGMVFPSFNVFKQVVKEHAIKTGKDIKFLKNDKNRVRVGCKPPCQWIIYASKMHGQMSLQVKTYVPTHNCDHNVGVSRSQLHRAKRKAHQLIEGNYKEQYAKLWDYCKEIRRTNPETTIVIKVPNDVDDGIDEDDEDSEEKSRFQRIYVCLGACKQGFLAGCRPFIRVDGCHLKGLYNGQILTAIGIYGNNATFPVAYVVVEGETRKSWKSFFELLQEDLGIVNHQGFTFMSDKQKGLIPALVEVIPNAEHRFCFEFHMHEVKEADEDAFKWLAEKPASFLS
ncbi:uncharacterized protein LOC114320353 [Camellia sinensis]|uniref:uncharacterized protein LOC114320353 n=1 Tax=Camellia sinensis TaxID=4442 RepID=UPI0010366263|nr:uncharacterized protein LOC114320353 [Camellia sinensis]